MNVSSHGAHRPYHSPSGGCGSSVLLESDRTCVTMGRASPTVESLFESASASSYKIS